MQNNICYSSDGSVLPNKSDYDMWCIRQMQYMLFTEYVIPQEIILQIYI